MNDLTKRGIIGLSILGVIIGGLIVLIPGQYGMTHGIQTHADKQPTQESVIDSGYAAGGVSHDIVMKTAYKDAPEKILVYKTLPPDVNKEATRALAEKFNVTGTLLGETALQSEDLVYGVQLTKNSGSAQYINAKRPNDAMDAPENLPSDDEAVRIATQFLKDRDLLPEGAVFKGTEREYAKGRDTNGNEKLYNGRIVVWYGRQLNGLEVDGSKISVDVGGSGDIIDYYSNWRDYEPYKEYPIKTPAEAFEDLKTEGVNIGINSQDTIEIEDMFLAYHSQPGSKTEYYLEPVWIFKGDILVEGKTVISVRTDIPALKDKPTGLSTT